MRFRTWKFWNFLPFFYLTIRGVICRLNGRGWRSDLFLTQLTKSLGYYCAIREVELRVRVPGLARQGHGARLSAGGTLVMNGGGAGLPTEETRGQVSVAIRTQSNLDL
ncbi:hypothetical protein J6590_068944 [Homalodisca vitripennis]|nr:hypothetical protein J6590_068944 [Homalodisca vitripennis]